MLIRNKTLGIISIVIALMFVGLYMVAETIVMESYDDLERKDIKGSVGMVEQVMGSELLKLNSTVGDWAAWDETYEFVNGTAPDFITTYLLNETYVRLDINFALFFDQTHELYYFRSVDLSTGLEVGTPTTLLDKIGGDDLLIKHTSPTSTVTGILRIKEGPLYFSSWPVLNSSHGGPIRGTLVMGRYIDAEEIDEIEEQTLIDLRFSILSGKNMSEDFQDALYELSDGTKRTTEIRDQDTISGYTLIFDHNGLPILIMRVSADRDIHNEGHDTTAVIFWSLLLIGLVFGITTIAILEIGVIRRVTAIHDEVERIGRSKDVTSRLESSGRDELTVLTEEINRMLDSLEDAQTDLIEKNTLHTANIELRKLDRQKSKFISMASHELRTPLVAIQGYVDLLLTRRSGDLTTEQVRMLEGISASSKRLNNIVSELLDVAKIEKEFLITERSSVDIAKVLDDVVKNLEGPVRRRKQHLKVDVPTNLPSLQGDRIRLTQVFSNLLGNAIKYSPDGGDISITARSDDRSHIRITVRDNGVGIEKDEIERIFSRLYEVQSSEAHGTGEFDFMASGAGLGLYIVRGIVEAHGGKVWADSDGKGKGSAFHVLLPVNLIEPEVSLVKEEHKRRSEDPEDKKEPKEKKRSRREDRPGLPVSKAGRSILVVDDSGDALDLIKTWYSDGFTIESAGTGAIGIKKIISDRPDVVLMKADLPGISGYEICKTLKGNERTRDTIIILFSEVEIVEETAIGSKADGVVELPLRKRKIDRIMSEARR